VSPIKADARDIPKDIHKQ